MGLKVDTIQNPSSSTVNLTLDTSGNVGLGTTPSASSQKMLQVGTSGSVIGVAGDGINLTSNAVYNSAWKYVTTGSATLYSMSAGLHIWYTNASGSAGTTFTPTEVMRIDTSGNVSIGTTAFLARLAAVSSGGTTSVLKNAASGGYARENYVSSNSGVYYFDFYGKYADSAQLGYISSNGTIMNYSTTSDVRLKENIVDAPSALPTLTALQVRSFDWKNGPHQEFGFIAQELAEVDPNAVVKGPTEDTMWGVDTSVLVPMLIKAVQELTAKVAALETSQ